MYFGGFQCEVSGPEITKLPQHNVRSWRKYDRVGRCKRNDGDVDHN